MRILIVDDNRDKASRLLEAILEVPGVNRDDVVIVDCAVGAKRCMAEAHFDLLLLDVQIPNRQGDAATKDGGYKLWQTVCRGVRYKRPAHVIAVTAFKETVEDLTLSFESESWLLLEYDVASTAWAGQIREKVEHIIALENQIAATRRLFRTDVVVITALDDPELAAVLRLPMEWKAKSTAEMGMPYSEGTFIRTGGRNGRIVATSAPQMGMPAAVCLTMKMIAEFSPEYVIMAGIAAGLKSANVAYGDVLIADPSWDWGSGKHAVEGGTRVFQPDPRPLRIDDRLATLCRRLANKKPELAAIRERWPSKKPSSALNVVVGPVASGSAVVADSAWVENIRKSSRKLVGIEMETYGVYYAAHNCQSPRPLVASLKGVCDYADAKKNDAYQHYAAYTSAEVLRLLLETLI